MTRNRQLWTLVLLGAAVAALALLSGGLSRLELQPGRPLPIAELLRLVLPHTAPTETAVPQLAIVMRVLVFLVVWVAFPVAVIALIVSSDLRRRFLKSLRTYIITAFLIYWLIRLLQKIIPTDGQPVGASGQTGASPDSPPLNLPTIPPFVADPPRWLVIALSVLVAVLVLLFIWSLRPRARREVDSLELLVQEAQTALNELEAGSNVRDTILRCYADMSRVLREARGVTRKEAMTPREFEQVLEGAGLRDEHIQQLTRLFERVRYGATKAGAREEREAVACLSAIVATYGKLS